MTFHVKLRNYRYDKHITQCELARRTGVSQRDISFWESGRGDPRLSAAVKIARGLGVSPEEFFRDISLLEEEEEV